MGNFLKATYCIYPVGDRLTEDEGTLTTAIVLPLLEVFQNSSKILVNARSQIIMLNKIIYGHRLYNKDNVDPKTLKNYMNQF